MYTTLAYRFPGERSIEELGMSEESKSKQITSSLDWGLQAAVLLVGLHRAAAQYLLCRPRFHDGAARFGLHQGFYGADDRSLTTPRPKGMIFAFYFGPNKY